MNTKEHLEKIKTKCQELLAIAEKRTPGEWAHWPTHWAGGSMYVKYSKENCPWINAEGKSDIARVNPFGAYANDESMANAAFIAYCAGPAEAGWRATIAAIEAYQFESTCDSYIDQEKAAEFMQQLIAAWPEELVN